MMRRYTYTDHRLGGPIMCWSPRREVSYPLVVTGLAIGRASFGRPFPVHNGEVIFECDAEDIVAADTLFQSATGLDVSKEAAISCDARSLCRATLRQAKGTET